MNVDSKNFNKHWQTKSSTVYKRSYIITKLRLDLSPKCKVGLATRIS